MKFNFKKVSAVFASMLMLGMTAGFAAAANYPAPFSTSGASGWAVVYGANAPGDLDKTQATSIAQQLQSLTGAGSGTAGIGSESFELWTSQQKIYLNDSINSVRSSLTNSQLPNLLADTTFDGNVNAKGTQKIVINSHPRVQFGQHPTSDSDPTAAVVLGTSALNHIYNATVSFDKAINFTHADSKNQPLTLFGQRYTVGSGSTETDLILFKSSETVQLGIGSGSSNPSSKTVTVGERTYTVELISATSSNANIRVTDSAGVSDSQTIDVGKSKRIRGLDVAVNNAFSSQAQNAEGATLLIGADRLKLTNGTEVKVGSDETAIDGTRVILGGTNWGSATSITFQVYAKNSDVDGIAPGSSFVDPIFKTFQINFPGLKESSNETISVTTVGSDKARVRFVNHKNYEKDVEWYYNLSANAMLGDSTGKPISSVEMNSVPKDGYLVLGTTSSKGEEGYLLKVVSIQNSSGTSNDKVELRDVFSDRTYTSQSISTEGTATISIEGTDYTVNYSRGDNDDGSIRVNSPQSSGNNLLLYQTIQTSKGAKLGFYEPVTINLNNSNGSGIQVSGLMFPNGNGFTTVSLTYHDGNSSSSLWNVTVGSTTTTVNTTAGDHVNVTVGKLTYTITGTGTNTTRVNLRESATGPLITLPALVLFEEEDGKTAGEYNALVVKMSGAGTTDNKVSVSDVLATWDVFGFVQMRTGNTNIYKKMDKWGTLVTHDRSTSGQYSATISYPDQQAYAEVLVSSTDSATTGDQTTELGGVLVKDTEVSSVSGRHLVVVGGSCINSVAAELLGVPARTCGAAFTSATGVGVDQYLIQSFNRGGKTALLVAGYEAADTAAGVSRLVNQGSSINTTAGKKYVYRTGTAGSSTLINESG